LNSETFIYEYIGEVISETAFRKRIKDYAEEGIQHFYFMMLQKEEVKKLCISRSVRPLTTIWIT